jgi:hypothetical protein
MARFQLTSAIVVGAVRIRAGKTIADSQANAQPGDAVWTGLNAGTMIAGMVPLDASATTMKNASPYASLAAATAISGVDSIDV